MPIQGVKCTGLLTQKPYTNKAQKFLSLMKYSQAKSNVRWLNGEQIKSSAKPVSKPLPLIQNIYPTKGIIIEM